MALAPGERVAVALVRGLHGLRGAVRIEVLTDIGDRFRVGAVLFADDDERPLTVAWTGPTKPGLLVRFAEFSTRESAAWLRDRYLEVVPEGELPDGAWYWHQVIGLEARTLDGEVLGRVEEVHRVGPGEVYVITGGPRGEILVPAVKAVVAELDPPAGRLVIDPAAMELPDPRPPRPPRPPRTPPTPRRPRGPRLEGAGAAEASAQAGEAPASDQPASDHRPADPATSDLAPADPSASDLAPADPATSDLAPADPSASDQAPADPSAPREPDQPEVG